MEERRGNRVVAKFLSASGCCVRELLNDDVTMFPGVGEMCVGAVCLLVIGGGQRHRLLTDRSKKRVLD
jgi:hypothetical protein